MLRPLSGLRGALREFFIVVTGVFVALLAQAWWERRHERGLERDYLRQLYVDTRENERRLAEAISEDSVAGIGAARALAALDMMDPQPAPDSLLEWVTSAGRSADFRPVMGSYRALLGTGDIRLIRNDSLRALLIAYAASLESENARLAQIRGGVINMIGTLARSLPFIRGIFLGDLDASRVNVAQLRRDEDAAVVLFTIQAANVNALAGLRRIRGETQRLRAALETEKAIRGRANDE
jgi:hypothetical protein